MDYEKKYKDALERARELVEKWIGKNKNFYIEDYSYIFPELKESEDERIRKAIIECVKNYGLLSANSQLFKNMLAWLEKQGKETSWKPSKEEMDVLYGLSYITNEFDERKEEVITRLYQDLKREFFNSASFENMFPTNTSVELEKTDDISNPFEVTNAMNEKQGKSKPADKVETKQKSDIEKGKWYVCNTDRYTDFVVGNAYYCPKNGMLKPDKNEMARYVARNCFRLWTIQDAKDGDVFVAEIDEEPNDFIYIFKEYNQNLGFWSHCYLDAYTNKFHEGIYHNNLNVGVPATKEQRDMFFQKMHEAGYEWDVEMKELNKIEKKFAFGEEEKQLLLKDLCARLPYYTKLWSPTASDNWAILTPVVVSNLMNADLTMCQVKPYLRPMSSMTEEERNEYLSIKMQETERVALAEIYRPEAVSEIMDWLNAHYFDYRGLIPMGLAVEAPEGMYS